MTNLKVLKVLSISAKLSSRIILPTLFCLAPMGPPHVIRQVFGQTSEPKPVARLIGGGGDSNSPSKPRVTSKVDAISTVVTTPSADEANEVERRAFAAINRVREKNGLPAFAWDQNLYRMARAHSRHMAVNGFFSHQTPGGLGLRDRARASGVRSFKVLAENIAYNQGHDDPGAFAVERWMVSPVHRANILSEEFQGSAIGSFVGPDQKIYLTQIFISR